jgi:hypothetical protein
MGVNKKWQATATVTVVDDSGVPVSGATVSGAWTGAYAGTSSGVTDTTGQVALTSGWAKPGTFTFTVVNVTHPNATWDSVPASGTVTVP